MIFGKLKRMMNSYIGARMKEKDKNLVRGVFVNKINDFDDDFADKQENSTLLDRLKGDLHGETEPDFVESLPKK